MDGIIIISTYPDKKSVQKIADLTVKKQLAACVNFTKISSVYTWKGRLEKTEEFLALFKTTNKAKSSLKKQISKLHPYQVPEVAELKLSSVNKNYLDWLISSTRGKSQK